MSNPLRRLAAPLAVAAALVAPAVASAQTELTIVPYSSALGRVADTDIDLTVQRTAAPTQRVDVYVPAGYRLATGQAAGTRLGTVALFVGAQPRAARYTGTVVTSDPARHAGDPCVPGTHAAVWLLNVTRPRPVTIPVYVDPVAGAEAALGAYRLTACFNPDVVPGVAGSKLRGWTINLPRVLTNPTRRGSYRWRAFVTPFGAGNVPNPAGQVEVRSLALLPQVLRLSARYDSRTGTVRITGRLVTAGRGERGVIVDILAGPRPGRLSRFAAARTRTRGAFSVQRRLTRTSYFWAFVDVYYGRCTGPASPAPGRCVRETVSPAFANFVRVVVRR